MLKLKQKWKKCKKTNIDTKIKTEKNNNKNYNNNNFDILLQMFSNQDKKNSLKTHQKLMLHEV